MGSQAFDLQLHDLVNDDEEDNENNDAVVGGEWSSRQGDNRRGVVVEWVKEDWGNLDLFLFGSGR